MFCEYCECALIEGLHPPIKTSVTIDHIVPIGNGGGMSKTDNFALSCLECNSEKGDEVAVVKQLVITIPSAEEGVEVTIKSAEVEGAIILKNGGDNGFIIQKEDLVEALEELEGFKGTDNDKD